MQVPHIARCAVALAYLHVAAAMAPHVRADDAVSFAEVRRSWPPSAWPVTATIRKDLKGEFDLRTRAAAIKGGESGEPAIVPGQPDKSPLYRAVTWEDDTLQMPPKENDRLTAEQVDADSPLDRRRGEVGRAAAAVANRRTGEPGRAARAASASPPAAAVRPSGTTAPTSRTPSGPISRSSSPPCRKLATIRRRGRAIRSTPSCWPSLQAKGIAGFAPPPTAARSSAALTFDLTGLPPTPEELDEFLSVSPSVARRRDGETRGREKAVVAARLLASPHYGEQQARHWLDVVRYADTAGFSNDFERPNAWRYRDYVIRSFNADKPFDRFVLEQLAGDELDPDDPEMLIAAGFLRMGPWEHTGMTVAAVTRQQFLDDVTQPRRRVAPRPGAALRRLPRPQVRPAADARLLPHAGGLRAGAVRRAAGAVPAERERRGFDAAKALVQAAARPGPGRPGRAARRRIRTRSPPSWPRRASSRSTSCPPTSGRSRTIWAARSA